MDNYKKRVLEEIKKHEGFREEPYTDTSGYNTVGYGFNQDATDTMQVLESYGYQKGNKIDRELADKALETIYRNKEGLLREKFSEQFDDFPEDQRVALGSLIYNSPSLLGPNLTQYVSSGDSLSAAKEILLNSNAKQLPGILKRRIEEAKLFSPLGDISKTLSSEDKEKLRNIINSGNDNVKREILDKYGAELNLAPTPVKFKKLDLSN